MVNERIDEAEAFAAARSTITRWLLEDNWKLQETTSEQTEWAVVAEDDQGKKIVLGQVKKRPDLIVLQASITPPDDLRAKIRDMRPVEARDELLWEIRFQLLNMGVRFSGVEVEFERIQLTNQLYLEDLPRNEFVRCLAKVQDAVLAIMWTMRRRLGQPAGSEEQKDLLM